MRRKWDFNICEDCGEYKPCNEGSMCVDCVQDKIDLADDGYANEEDEEDDVE